MSRKATASRPGIEADAYLASVSKRIWIAFAVLGVLLVAAAIGFVHARGQLTAARAALHEAEARAAAAEAQAKSALEDKQGIMKELASQGALIAQSSRDEEKARAELEALQDGSADAKKRATALAAEVKSLKAKLAKAQRARAKAEKQLSELQARAARLTSELGDARARLESAMIELERARGPEQPYGPSNTQLRR